MIQDSDSESFYDRLEALLSTFPRFHDRQSRQAVRACLTSSLRNESFKPQAFRLITDYIKSESQRAIIAPTNAFVLLEWCVLVQQQIPDNPEFPNTTLSATTVAAARSLEKCLRPGVRPGLKRSALVLARRGLRSLLKPESFGTSVLATIIPTLITGANAVIENLPYLGVIAGVCARLPGREPELKGNARDVLSFYAKVVLGSKRVVSTHIASSLHDLFASFISLQDILEIFIPPLEKSILRSPEVVLGGLIPSFVNSLPSTFDTSKPLSEHLLQPLLSSLKSTNTAVKEGAVEAFLVLVERCKDVKALSKIAEDVLVPLKSSKASTPEVRTLLARLVLAIPSALETSHLIVLGVAPIAAKEANENALESEAAALCKHLAILFRTGFSIEQVVLDAISKGCRDKRPGVRKSWYLKIGEVFWELDSTLPRETRSSDFVKLISEEMIQAFEEISSNPVASLQSGQISAGFILVALIGSGRWDSKVNPILKRDRIVRQSLVISPRPSFMLHNRIITRLSTPDEMLWVARALMSISSDLVTETRVTRSAWAQILIYFLVALDVPTSVRRATRDAIALHYLAYPMPIAESIFIGLWDWLHSLHLNEKESLAIISRSGAERLHVALDSVNVAKSVWDAGGREFPAETIKNQLVLSLVLCQGDLIRGSSWIETCLRVGVDPGALVHERHDDLMIQVLLRSRSGISNGDRVFRGAACKAAADLAFIAPETMLPTIVDQISSDLDPTRFQNLGPLDAAIARSPEGVVFVDVLAQSAQNDLGSNNLKDHDILKWEADLRAHLAKKKGQAAKLTADQQAKVDARLERESATRKTVRVVQNNLRRGATLVQALAEGPPTDAGFWMSKCIGFLLDALHAGAALFIDEELASAYLICSNKISPRLGTLGKFVGVATLRAAGNARLPQQYEVEPLGELVTRVLYRLRFTAEQRPFDLVTLSYILPLVVIVLDHRAVGCSAGEEADTQVLLSLEFLTFHMSACSDLRLPRDQILDRLISAMQKYTQHYRLLKEALVDLCRSISDNIQPNEIHVLLKGVTSTEASIRSAVLQAIHAEIDLTSLDSSKELWLVCHDPDEETAELAAAIWEENALSEEERLVFDSMEYLGEQDLQLRSSAARALTGAIAVNPTTFSPALQRLEETYAQAALPIVPKRDKYGMVQKGNTRDPWELRSGISMAFREMHIVFTQESLVPFLQFLIRDGPLADRSSSVRSGMMDAGITLASTRGKESLEPLMKLCKTTLDAPDKGTKESDWVHEAVIILYGSLARHLLPGDGRVQEVISQLLASLSTPSESVQLAVSGCLPPLVRLVDTQVSSYVEQLLKQLFESKQYASRRGAAYGIAGLVRGRGLASLRQYRIMSALQSATENKKSADHRQGAMFAYELLSLTLGRTFEPYTIEVLPQLLSCFGDGNAAVRDACLDTAKICFASLSSFGVKQVLPRLLEGLDDSQWRSKKGACDLLGAMAYLDPQQLAISLPDIIPPLAAVLNDSHKEVRLSANRSLQRFGEVISNPEVKSLVDILLKALSDPTKYTEEALDGLIKVSFVHYLDAPSLALVVRILERGLADRSSTKRKSAQIIGSLAHLTERKDLVTHLPILVTGLRQAAVDPVPGTRATASKALGSLVEKLGEDALPDLIPSLMASLRTDTGAGDRLGSAQALSEVLAGLGTARLEETMPTILQNVASSKPTVREGFMTLFIFLPACFGNSFASYLSQIIPSILGGLADELEAIRDIALRAGRLLVKNFSTKAIDLLLPELQRGLADYNYRIRLSSVELVGDLLFNLTGISNKADAEDDEGEGAAQAGQSLLEALGEDRRNKVLSSLYICRCDTSGMVRTAAIAVWKALVATPRTLRELVPTLTHMIISRLASPNLESRAIAGNALGEVVRKAGEGVLASLLPSLEDDLQTSTDADTRQGICTALREIITSASPDALEDYEKKLVSILRLALVDSDNEVRDAAAEAFDSFQKVFGRKAVDHVLPYLLNLLRDSDEASNALSALLTLLTETTRANMILPNLIPTLLSPPITAFNAKALASLAEVGGQSMNRRLPAILNSLADGLTAKTTDSELRDELNSAFDAVLCSVDEYDGLNTAMGVVLAMIKHDDHRRRAVAASHLAVFFSSSTVDFSRYNQDLIRVLLISFDDRDTEVVKASWTAMSQLTAHLRKEEMESLVISTRQTLQQVGVAGSNLPGFSLPKGILPVLQIFLQGLMNGTVDQRTQAASAISDIIDRTSSESLKPFVTQITGPLIRVVSERSVDVKCAILHTLNELLEKIPTFLKPFLPQLQRTFTKSLADPSSETLRLRATKALSTLITLTPRVDPLIAELVTGCKTSDLGVRNAMLKGLQEVVSKVGSNMSDNSKDAILGLIDSSHEVQDDATSVTNSRLLGALVRVLPRGSAGSLIKSRVLCHPMTNTSILALNAVLLESSASLINDHLTETRIALTNGVIHKSLFIQQNSVLAAGKFLLAEGMMQNHSEAIQPNLDSLATALQPGGDIDARRLALVVIRTVSRKHPVETRAYLPKLAPAVFAGVRDPVIPVKLAAEAAFLQLFSVVEDESDVFDEYMKSEGKNLGPALQRSMQDYFKRVALRLGGQARERKEAEGGAGGLGLAGDEAEDERELWSVGRVEIGGDDAF
jgi:Generalcontrol nonderepressible 1 (Gcn1) N-terminal/HEAT-like repeat/Parkin co-regulated protein